MLCFNDPVHLTFACAGNNSYNNHSISCHFPKLSNLKIISLCFSILFSPIFLYILCFSILFFPKKLKLKNMKLEAIW